MYMIKILIETGSLRKEDIISLIDISDLTFRRYVQELRAFFMNFGMNEKLIYNREEDVYQLIDNN